MHCRFCHGKHTRVQNVSHLRNVTLRYIRCLDCDLLFKTRETYADYERDISTYDKQRNKSTCPDDKQVRGSACHNTALTEDNIRELRQLATQGYTAKQLGIRYGLCLSSVYRILKRITWKHI